ncbi:hypothetical protein [Streptomyces sp. NPDC013455]|uniref:hypothetical protein n=1 Tax=Streptomyces sp. NPDC013455 TaxID=3155605 RepID=UPI0033DB82D4
MSQENDVEADPTTDADEAVLERVLAARGDTAASEHGESVSEVHPARASGAQARPDGSPAARRKPESE